LNGKGAKGAVLVIVLVFLLVILSIGSLLVRQMVAELRQGRLREAQLQAFWIGESAVQRARAQLNRSADYRGESWQTEFESVVKPRTADVSIQVDAAGDMAVRRIIVQVQLKAGAHPIRYRRDVLVEGMLEGESA
jgi:Tfp pilus assembly protein PilX